MEEEKESCWVEEERPSFWRMHLGTADTVEGTSELTLLNTFVKELSHGSVQNCRNRRSVVLKCLGGRDCHVLPFECPRPAFM